MKPLFETDRCYLRPFEKGDGYHFYHINSDSEVLKYTGDVAFNSLEDAHRFIEQYNQYEINGYGRWAVLLKKTDAFIGWCGLKYEPDTGETDLGYRFYRNQWGMGFATETTLASIKFGFEKLKLKSIVGRAYFGNDASIRVLEKCGMKFERNMIFDERSAVMYRVINPNI